MKFYKLLLFLCIISMYSCNKGKQLQTHNQLADELEIHINEEIYVLQPNESKTLLHNYGENKIKSIYQNKVLVDTVVDVKREQTQKGLLLNVTGKPYYLLTETYESSSPLSMSNMLKDMSNTEAYDKYAEAQQKKMLARLKVVMVDTVQMIGEIEKIPSDQLLIQKNWYYNINTDFEESIEVHSRSSSSLEGSRSFTKIFSEKGLIDYWNSQE